MAGDAVGARLGCVRSAAADLAAVAAVAAWTALAAARGMGEHPDLGRLAGRERHEDVGGDAAAAAAAAAAAVATPAAISPAARGNDALDSPLAGRALAAVATPAAGSADPAIAAAAGRGQDGQRAGKLADGDLGKLARTSGASLGAVTASGARAAVCSVGGARHDRAQQPGAEPCLRGRRGDAGAPGASAAC